MTMPEGWPKGKFGAILADPPWPYNTWDGNGGSAEAHYKTQPTGWIKDLPVMGLAANDSVLFMWAVYPRLPDAIEVMQAWGYEFKTVAFTWLKVYAGTRVPFMGMGHWTRSNAEIVLLGTRGHPKRRSKNVEQAILSPVREHSRKPEIVHERIERLVDGPYCELFARCQHPGWTAWGNQVGKFAHDLPLWSPAALEPRFVTSDMLDLIPHEVTR